MDAEANARGWRTFKHMDAEANARGWRTFKHMDAEANARGWRAYRDGVGRKKIFALSQMLFFCARSPSWAGESRASSNPLGTREAQWACATVHALRAASPSRAGDSRASHDVAGSPPYRPHGTRTTRQARRA